MEMTGAQMMAESLIRQGVSHIFVGPPGPCAFVDALYPRQDVIKPILVRHEQVGANMADGFFKAGHKPGVFCVHGGPGLQNTVIGLATSLVHSSAVIAIAGITATRWWGKGGHQEMGVKEDADSNAICKPIVKQTFGVVRPDRIPEIMHRAFNVATMGKPGPVLVSVPVDIFPQTADVEISEPEQHRPQHLPMGDPSSLEQMAAILASARRPVLIAGGGAMIAECGAEVRQLAEKLSIPVATSYSGKGAFPEDHALSISAVGAWGTRCANRVISEADVILALGTRLNQSIANGWSYADPFAIPPSRLLQIDINPHEIGRNFPVEVGAVGDLKSSLRYIIQVLEKRGVQPPADLSWARKAAACREEWQRELFPRFHSAQTPIQPERAVRELRDLLPRESIVFADAGNNRGHICNLWTTYAPQTLFMDSGNVAMGYGPSAALGAQLARPDQLVVSISGDGGFIPRLSAKAYPCCLFTHGPVEAVKEILKENPMESPISRLTVRTNRSAFNLCGQPLAGKQRPAGRREAMFSIPYVLANYLVKEKVFFDDFLEENIREEKVLALASKIIPEVDPVLEALGTSAAPVIVDVLLENGKKYSARVDTIKGHPQNPMDFAECAVKFKQCARYAARRMDDSKLETLIAQIENLEQVEDVSSLVAQLT